MIATEPVGVLPDSSLDPAPQVQRRRGAPAHARTQPPVHTRTRNGVTPVRLRLMAIGLAVLALLVGLVTALAANDRDTATAAASQTAEPLVVEAQAIDTYLSDADTTAAGSFLQGQLQPETLRTSYMSDVALASTNLALAAQAAGSDPAVASDIRSVAVNLPVYTGLVQTATFNERQAYYPLATAYIGEANNLMRLQILPAAARLYTVENRAIGERPGQHGELTSPLDSSLLHRGAVGAPHRGAALDERSLSPDLQSLPRCRNGHRVRPRAVVHGRGGRPELERRHRHGQRIGSRGSLHPGPDRGAPDDGRRRAHPPHPELRSHVPKGLRRDRDAVQQPHGIGRQGSRVRRGGPDQAGRHCAGVVCPSAHEDQAIGQFERCEATRRSSCPGVGERSEPSADRLVEPRQRSGRGHRRFPAARSIGR